MTDPGSGISVPGGGGALKGIGETFQPDLHTGTANLSVPIPLPPGRGTLTPTLTLAYSSGNGNGPFGLGWSLAVPRISRRTDRGVPVYDDTIDVFVLSGAEELAPVPLGAAAPGDLRTGASVTRYRPRTEAGFARIVHVTGAGNDYWDVWSRDGLRSRYGTQLARRPATGWLDPAAISTRPDGTIFSWLLTSTQRHLRQPHRLRLPCRPAPAARSATCRPCRLRRLRRPGRPRATRSPSRSTTARRGPADPPPIARPDPFSDRRPGFELRTTLRASRISVTTLASDRDAGHRAVTTAIDLTYRRPDRRRPGRQPVCRCSPGSTSPATRPARARSRCPR